VPGAIGHSILKPENPILTESQSSLGVLRPRAFTLSLLLLVLADEFTENPPFWQRLDCPISTPPPLENDPTPFTKYRRLVPVSSYSTGVVKSAVLMKKTSDNGYCLIFNNYDFILFFFVLILTHSTPCPQKLSDRTGFAQNFGLS